MRYARRGRAGRRSFSRGRSRSTHHSRGRHRGARRLRASAGRLGFRL